MTVAAARHTRKVPIRLTVTTRAKSACAIGPSLPTTRPRWEIPAQQTASVSPPSTSTASAMARSAAASEPHVGLDIGGSGW